MTIPVLISVMPAQAGIQFGLPGVSRCSALDSRFRGHDDGGATVAMFTHRFC